MCVVSVGAEVAQVFCYLGKVSYMYLGMYPRTSSRSYMSKTSVLWLTIDSYVLPPCRRTPYLLT